METKHIPTLKYETAFGWPFISVDGILMAIPSLSSKEKTEQSGKEIVRRYSTHQQLLKALKYSRRFLNRQDHDCQYVDDIIALATGSEVAE